RVGDTAVRSALRGDHDCTPPTIPAVRLTTPPLSATWPLVARIYTYRVSEHGHRPERNSPHRNHRLPDSVQYVSCRRARATVRGTDALTWRSAGCGENSTCGMPQRPDSGLE